MKKLTRDHRKSLLDLLWSDARHDEDRSLALAEVDGVDDAVEEGAAAGEQEPAGGAGDAV